MMISTGGILSEEKGENVFPPGFVFHANSKGEPNIPDVASFDAILILGGGAPSSISQPPIYVTNRCDAAARVFKNAVAGDNGETGKTHRGPAILCLSAGTAHVPQLMGGDGLPIWEATSSAAYLMENYDIPPSRIFVETTSYDTISNAYFARMTHTDVAGWRKLLIITNEFHMERAKAIFDWVFGAENELINPSSRIPYELYYLSCDNVGLTKEAVQTRKEREAKSLKNIKENLSKRSTLQGIWEFLTEDHELYSAEKLVSRAKRSDNAESDLDLNLRISYGAKPHQNYHRDRSSSNGGMWSFAPVVMILSAVVALSFLAGRTRRSMGTFIPKKE